MDEVPLGKVITIPIQKGLKLKSTMVKLPKDKLTHNRMLVEAMFLIGAQRQVFEALDDNPTFEQRNAQAQYVAFYKHHYMEQSFH